MSPEEIIEKIRSLSNGDRFFLYSVFMNGRAPRLTYPGLQLIRSNKIFPTELKISPPETKLIKRSHALWKRGYPYYLSENVCVIFDPDLVTMGFLYGDQHEAFWESLD